MLISGIQKFTMIDFPGCAACIVFTPGCNFRCGFCHNPEFVLPEMIEKIKDTFIPENIFFNFLEQRKNVLDGVVITGGEPTLMQDLADFIIKIKSFGLKVKLDSNGNNPDALKNILDKKLIDYIAMDIKTSYKEYKNIAGSQADPDKIKKSISLIMWSDIPYEFRTTVLKELHPESVLKQIAEMIKGAEKFYLQKYRSGHILNKEYEKYSPYTEDEMEKIKKIFEKYINSVQIR
jgi:pyruvate formate lyase activating enzyme